MHQSHPHLCRPIVPQVKGIRLRSLVSTANTGLRIALNGFPALYLDYIRREATHGRVAVPAWAGEQVGVYTFGWDGTAFVVSYEDFMKTKLIGALNVQGKAPDTLTFGGNGLPKIVFKRLSTGAGSTCVLACRYGSSPGECKFAGKTC